MKMINQKGAQLEIIYEYGYYRRRLYICDLILRHPTDRMECQVEIPAIQKMECCWNEIDPKRVW
ncbi:MAG: hypothetical protein IJE08_01165 [Clostridia bacterium]|nr:hypothetical protein [Clostridia bacterium]